MRPDIDSSLWVVPAVILAGGTALAATLLDEPWDVRAVGLGLALAGLVALVLYMASRKGAKELRAVEENLEWIWHSGGTSSAMPGLEERFLHPSPLVRLKAAEALERLPAAGIEEKLRERARDPDPEVARASSRFLDFLKSVDGWFSEFNAKLRPALAAHAFGDGGKPVDFRRPDPGGDDLRISVSRTERRNLVVTLSSRRRELAGQTVLLRTACGEHRAHFVDLGSEAALELVLTPEQAAPGKPVELVREGSCPSR